VTSSVITDGHICYVVRNGCNMLSIQLYNRLGTVNIAVAVEIATSEMDQFICHPDLSNYKDCKSERSLT
jgi:hypothetical protein